MLATQFAGTPRRYWQSGDLYVIRDIYQRTVTWPNGIVRRQHMRCEYAVRNPNGSKKWVRCTEGTEFSAIQPLRHRKR